MSFARSQHRSYGKKHNAKSISNEELRQLLIKGTESLPFQVDEGAVERLAKFVELLHKWNQVYNLTSVRDMAQMVSRHIMDSLIVHPYLQGHAVLDVGCGAGLPGIPLAIMNPDKMFTLLDSNSKKTRFVQQASNKLGCENIKVVTERVEDFQAEERFNTIIARAYSAMDNLITGSRHLLADNASLLAMKGTLPVTELENIPEGFEVEKVEPLTVPMLDAERHLIIIRPV